MCLKDERGRERGETAGREEGEVSTEHEQGRVVTRREAHGLERATYR